VSMRAELRELHARLGSTMIYVTHDQVEAMTLADKIVVLRGGQIEQVGSPQALYERPVNRFVAGFIGSPRMNFIPTTALVDAQALAAGLPAGTLSVGVRPEHLRCVRVDESSEFRLNFTVDQAEYMGAASLLQGKLADGTRLEVLLQQAAMPGRGEVIALTWDAALMHCFDAQEARIAA
jgi:multiple sugar transport system ATP-binding protein